MLFHPPIRRNPAHRRYFAAITSILTILAASQAWAADPTTPPKALTMFPAAGAKEISPDSPLKIQFDTPPTVGTGKIQIFDAADNSLVEAIDVTPPAQTAAAGGRGQNAAPAPRVDPILPIASQPIGGGGNKRYYPVIITGNQAAIYPKSHELVYGKNYYVTIDPEAFKDAAGNFAGISGNTTWNFSTRAQPPKPGTTRITVAADGSGDFCTVQGALDFVPENNTTPTTIFLKKGTYNELLVLRNKSGIAIVGEDRKESVIAYSNNPRLNGARSVIQTSNAKDFVMENLTVWDTTPRLSGSNQAECIIFGGDRNSDDPSGLHARCVLSNIDLKSFQDTLQINEQAFVGDSYIEGDIDFMWGTGPVFFENLTAKMITSRDSYVETRNPPTNHGFVFYHGTFIAADGVMNAYLAQSVGSCEMVTIDCVMGDWIGPVGWRLNNNGGRGGPARGGATNPAAPAGGMAAGGPPAAPAVGGAPATGPATAGPFAGGGGRGGRGGRGGGGGGGRGPAVIHYWEYNSHYADGKPIDVSQRDPQSRQLKLPDDAETLANYSNPTWVLGNNWIPMTARATQVPVKAGSPLSFSATKGYALDAVFQWKKDGKEIASATGPVYEIKSATAADAGDYTLTVKNSAGTITSAVATIKVAE